MSEKCQPLPKFGEWDVNDSASAEGFTVIFNKARDEKKTNGKPESPARVDPPTRPSMNHHKPPSSFCRILSRWSYIYRGEGTLKHVRPTKHSLEEENILTRSSDGVLDPAVLTLFDRHQIVLEDWSGS